MNFNRIYITYKALFDKSSLFVYLFNKIFNPACQYGLYILMAITFSQKKLINDIVIGSVCFIGIETSITGAVSMILLEKRYHTLGLIEASPSSLFFLSLDKSVISCLDATITIFLNYIIISIFFKIYLPKRIICYLMLGLIILIFSTCVISMLISAISLMCSQINLILNFIISLLQITSGSLISIMYYPKKIRNLCLFLPFTNIIEYFKQIILNHQVIPNYLLSEFLISIFFLFNSYLIFTLLEYFSRKNGSLLELS